MRLEAAFEMGLLSWPSILQALFFAKSQKTFLGYPLQTPSHLHLANAKLVRTVLQVPASAARGNSVS